MSLFGGDAGAQPSDSSFDSEAEQSQDSSTRPSPSPEREPTPQDAPNTEDLYAELEADFASQSESESESDEPTRPNRFQGPRYTWRKYTAADREIAESLDQTQNQDLAAHLYNAHALKKRVRRPPQELAGLSSWQNNEHWLKKGDELQYADISGEMQTNLVPSKDWTAWPLPPPETRKPHRESGRGTISSWPDDWTIGNADEQDIGEELRDEMLATILRQAKERWRARETADASVRELDCTARSRSRSRSKSIKSARSHRSMSRADTDANEDDLGTEDGEAQEDEQGKFGHILGKRRGRVVQRVTHVTPTFLADDAKARRILDPMINSILTKADDLALAIRRTRLNHFGRKDYTDRSSQSDWTSGMESSRPTPKRTSRTQSGSRPGSRNSSRPASRASSVRSRHGAMKAGRRLRNNSSDSGTDSDSDVVMDDAKAEPLSKTRSRPGSTADERSPSATRDETGRAGLMDWSEVLGLAAVKGWDERVIARATQRCATLFGESMSFITLDENRAAMPVSEPVQYAPSTIPAPNMTASRPVPKRPLFPIGTWRCPHVGCYGHEKDFESPHRVVEHCKRVHGYDPRTNDSDNEDRAVGGVHIDGFLQPIVAQRGWLERGKSRAGREKKRQKMAQVDGASEDVAVTIESD
ncbi:hypothetical protein HBH64_130100 [Parastagonospora nodorum]|nr:hypothetical protein HBH52_152750 [Parastagonospora nodorum]KAH4005290.1 hypothetical protein HBI10_034990 [Parastagonospora nodorum]KAH4032945.1 hypothetical protein HBI13_004140 [Parastagonospora nodorum]KAH4229399.1 hypothetical protein HBI06_092500 [Parastagonospora nodorum]KAH4249376.1 hypothetical protein HBI05_004470 [Parastagonospora nodorum]